MNGSAEGLSKGVFITAVRENREELRRNSGWILCLGILLIIIGCLAVSSAFVATLATMIFLGFVMLLAGVMEVAGAFWVRHRGGFFLGLLMGVLLFLAGI